MKKPDAIIATVGAAGGGILAFVSQLRAVGITHWKTFAGAVLGAFYGALFFLSMAYMIGQIRQGAEQRRRFLWGAFEGVLLALPVFVLWPESERSSASFVTFALFLSITCAFLFLLNGERHEVPTHILFSSILIGGYVALLTALLLNVKHENYGLFLLFGIFFGSISAKTVDYFFG